MVLLVGMVCAVVYTLEANSHLAESQLLVHMHRAKVEDDDFQKNKFQMNALSNWTAGWLSSHSMIECHDLLNSLTPDLKSSLFFHAEFSFTKASII